MSIRFTVSDVIPADPMTIYDAWLNGRAHSAMTGAKATASAKVGGAFTAWDGYSFGTNVELVPGQRIVQSWRTTDFAQTDPDSRITVTLKAVEGGTKVTLLHTRVPSVEAGYADGWREYYFAPMKAYFARKRKAAK